MDETTSYPFSTTEEAFDLQQSLEFPPLGANTTNVKDLKDIKMNAYLVSYSHFFPKIEFADSEKYFFVEFLE